MNKAITDGLTLMPPPFSAGLDVWSSQDGTPGSATYHNAPNAVYVPADADFAGCLELLKTDSLQKLRWMGETPILPGCYLRVTARVKALSGNLPGVRIAAWAGGAGGAHVADVLQVGPEVQLSAYGTVVEVSAIIGTGNRGGVDMPWVRTPIYGHVGLDLTGANGGVVRIDDLVVEDITAAWLRDMLDWVDVRDYGATGDGVSDDHAAFIAALQAANGRGLLVSEGSYFIGSNLTIDVPVRFEGTLVMDMATRLQLTRSYDFPSYEAAFGDAELGFRKAVQALFHFTDHVTLDLKGRRVPLSAPVDVAALAGIDSFAQRRVIANGQIDLQAGPGWDTVSRSRQATYSPEQPTRLSGVNNVEAVPVGALVSAAGVGREVYVTETNPGAGTLTLSQPLHDAEGTQTYSFERFAYALDFSGFAALSVFEVQNIEMRCFGHGSAIMLPRDGRTNVLRNCTINRPKDRGVTSIGSGCQGMFVDHCQFISNEADIMSQDRVSVALNINANDCKIRNNRAALFRHFLVTNGTGHLILGNHFFQGDSERPGTRLAGIVLTRTNAVTSISGNYVDNCFIEWTNEHSADPEWNNQFSFGGLSITGNVFLSGNSGSWFRFIVIKPYGPGHFIQGLNIAGNVFRTIGGRIDRVEAVDTTHATLAFNRFRNVTMQGNAYNGVDYASASPLVLQHDQNSAMTAWTLDTAGILPFGGWARHVQAFVFEGALTGPNGEPRSAMPHVSVQQGANNDQVRLHFPEPTKGRAHVTVRVDNPL